MQVTAAALKKKTRLAVLASGNGTNLQALIDAWNSQTLDIEFVAVISNKEHAKALQRAKKADIENIWLDPAKYATRKDFDHEIIRILKQKRIDLVVLAGYMRILSDIVVQAFAGRIMNVHPSLLPSFPGLNAIQQALDHGVKVTGCTVHLVDEGVDTGPIILQAAVSIDPDDTVQSLADKIRLHEHALLVQAVQLFAIKEIPCITRQ